MESVGVAKMEAVGVAEGLALLDAAVIAMAVGIFEAQAHLWTIFLQVEELLAVEGSTTSPGKHWKNYLKNVNEMLYRYFVEGQ